MCDLMLRPQRCLMSTWYWINERQGSFIYHYCLGPERQLLYCLIRQRGDNSGQRIVWKASYIDKPSCNILSTLVPAVESKA